MQETTDADRVRLDKWLWAARFYKTRTLAAEQIAKGRVDVNGRPAKASRELRPGDEVALRAGGLLRVVIVRDTCALRGPAPGAQRLYEETADSVAARERAVADRRQGVEPALAIDAGRPTKRDRRKLVEWERWSVADKRR